MKQDLFTYLPPEMTIDILSRLPIRSIILCKCVCKSWLDLIESNEFVKSHLSKSVPGLAVFQGAIFHSASCPKPYKFLEFVDEPGPENLMHHCNIVFNLSFPHHHVHIHSSVNGLLFLLDLYRWPHNHFVCNPITRDYIKLPRPHESSSSERQVDKFGFGVSKKSGQYKVVRIFHECIPFQESDCIWHIVDEIKCQVYSLGTGSWRSINAPSGPLRYNYDTAGTFLNGNLHWRVRDWYSSTMLTVGISCFDLETELFTIFSAPPIHGCHAAISALEERLVFCDNSYDDERNEIVIWFMDEYGDEKSWAMKFIITKTSPDDDFLGGLCPIKIFEDGDILIARGCHPGLLCYSNKTKTIVKTDLAELYGYDRIGAVSYTPSFLPLKTFTLENVSFF